MKFETALKKVLPPWMKYTVRENKNKVSVTFTFKDGVKSEPMEIGKADLYDGASKWARFAVGSAMADRFLERAKALMDSGLVQEAQETLDKSKQWTAWGFGRLKEYPAEDAGG